MLKISIGRVRSSSTDEQSGLLSTHVRDRSRDRDQKMKLSRYRNKNVQLFNIQNSISFHKFTVIGNDVMF